MKGSALSLRTMFALFFCHLFTFSASVQLWPFKDTQKFHNKIDKCVLSYTLVPHGSVIQPLQKEESATHTAGRWDKMPYLTFLTDN